MHACKYIYSFILVINLIHPIMLEYEFKNLVSNQNQSNNEKKTKKKKTTFSLGW
jgi:hypothetical protein